MPAELAVRVAEKNPGSATVESDAKLTPAALNMSKSNEFVKAKRSTKRNSRNLCRFL